MTMAIGHGRAHGVGSFTAGLVLLAGAGGPGCGGTSAKILERIDAASPPGLTLRMDVFVIRSFNSCAVGTACTARDPTQCFYLADGAGIRSTFDPDTVRFLAPGDPEIAAAAQSRCFRLGLDDAAIATAGELVTGLRTRIFQSTGGDINVDARIHDVASVDAAMNRYTTGMFLPPSSLESVALGALSRETDFTFAVTGFGDPATGLQPRIDECAGTNWLDQGGLGGSTYSWVALAPECAQPGTFLAGWLYQAYFGLRDVVRFDDPYRNSYPGCGAASADATTWFPWIRDCTTDPDATSCGASACPDWDAYYSHILGKHWSRGRGFNGNYCSDGRMDFDETGVDVGGRCDLLGL